MPSRTELRTKRRARPLHRVESRLCRAVALLCEIDGQEWCGFASRRDYARARMGVAWGQFCQWRRTGLLLLDSPRARSLLDRGQLTPSGLDLIARYAPPGQRDDLLPIASKLSCAELRELLRQPPAADCEHPATNTEEGSELRQITLPSNSLPYVFESVELAHALRGRDGSDEEALEAILSEVESELDPACTPDPPEVRGQRRRPKTLLQWSALPQPQLEPRRGRSVARKLDALIQRLLGQRRMTLLEEEDQLLAQLESGSHREAGYRNFEQWCDRKLKLAPRTAWQRIQRARQRRRSDLIATARAEGRLTAVHADLLGGLRELGVAADALPTWIELAPRITTQRLRAMIRWARLQDATNRTQWAESGFLPPSREQLQTSNRAIEDIALDPAPPDPKTLDNSRLSTLRWRLRTPVAEQLDTTIASLQGSGAPAPGQRRRTPKWWAFLHALALARLSWATQVDDPSVRKRMRAVFRRDRYRCQAPECSWRRNLQSHHLRYRSRGGGDELSNLLTLCPFHHQQGEHGGLTRVRGQVHTDTDDLLWEMGLDDKNGPLLRYQGDTVLEPEVEGVKLAV